ncbi:ABC transporter permease [Anaerotruncus rubiinfantis]|uniref:ABC transporter permease n=1 Tax=Anaerotruncus rubiinfantis TaxID=1720200 RepID=UPI0034A33DAC
MNARVFCKGLRSGFRRGVTLALLLVSLFCGLLGADGYRQAALLGGGATFCCESAPLLAEDFPAFQKLEQRAENPAVLAAWSQLNGQRVQSPLTGRESKAAVLFFRGDSRQALPVAQALSNADQTGCLIDRETARQLFGSENAVGNEIAYAQKNYMVRGVFGAPVGTMILRAPDSTVLTSLTIADGAQRQAFLTRHGLSPDLWISHKVYAYAAKFLCLTPVVLLAAWTLQGLLRTVRRQRDYPARWALLFFLSAAAVTLLMLGIFQVLPVEWIPSRWSDFSFWSETVSVIRVQAVEFLAAQKTRQDLILLRFTGQAAWGILSAAALGAAIRLGAGR